ASLEHRSLIVLGLGRRRLPAAGRRGGQPPRLGVVSSETTVERPLSYAHLLRLSDAFGVVEHARGLDPRTNHGYCLDDMARALILLARDPDLPAEVGPLFATSADFVVSA